MASVTPTGAFVCALIAGDARRCASRRLSAALRLVDGAYIADQVAERESGPLAVALEQPRESRVSEPAQPVDPHRQREVVEGEDGCDAELVAGLEHPPVVIELGGRELTVGRLDARPLDAEPERVDAEPREHRDVVAVAVVEVAGVARGLDAGRAFAVLPPPPVGVRVAALDLVRADSGAEKESLGEGGGHFHSSFPHVWGHLVR